MGQVPGRGTEMKKYHDVEDVAFDGDTLFIKVDGNARRFALADVSLRLLAASPPELARFEISPAGYGIHWPLLDEDLSIDGLLGIAHAPSIAKGKAA
jgi:Protein of unknown function (DUF2442)